MRRVANLVCIVLSSIVLSVCLSGISWCATLSGSISNPTSKSGRLYIMLLDQNSGQTSGYGTTIANVAANTSNIPYTIKGVRQGTYSQVIAWLDTRGNGSAYGDSPVGSTDPGSPINVSSTDIPDLNFSIQGQGTQTLAAPLNLKISPMNGGALITWDPPKNANDIEIAEKYNVYWSTASNVGPGNTVGGGSKTDIPSRNDGHLFIPLTNGTSYYFAVEAILGTSSAISRTASSTTIGAPAGGHTVTVNINFDAAPPVSQLLTILETQNGPIFGALATSPVQNQTINIAGVPDGSYRMFIVLDKNSNGYVDTGDVYFSDSDYLSPMVLVQGTNVSTPPLNMLVNRNLEALITTQTQFAGFTNYQINFDLSPQEKQPAHAVINSGPQMVETSIGPNFWGGVSLNASVPALPKSGDSYNLTVTYTDNTTETLVMNVSNVFNKAPNQTYPTGNTAPSSTNPRFAWNTLSGLPESPYMYHLTLQQANSFGDHLWEKYLTPDKLSVQYDGPVLSIGTTYNWGIHMYDKYGNRSSSWQQFTPQASGPVITSLSATTLPCGSSTPVIITGSGFSSTPGQNSVYFNNSYAVTPTAASNTQLTVNLPACSNAPSTGPIIVATNSQNVASAVEFIPTFTYNYYLSDWSATPVALTGARVELADNPSVPAVFTNDSGFFSLSGIPTGVPYRLKFTKDTYMPVYSAYNLHYSNTTIPSTPYFRFSMPQQSNFNTWGVQAGKGLIHSRTRDASVVTTDNTNYLGGVTVNAYSSNHNSSSYYTVAYTNPANTATFVSGPGTSTHTDGRYYILNVDDGDVVTVTAQKTNYVFPARIFTGVADALGQSSINGTPAVSISGFTPASAVPGNTIIINGSNFNSNPSSNSVCFGMSCTSPTTATTNQLTVTLPCGAQSGPIKVSANNQTVYSTTSLNIISPTITGIFPAQGPLNANVTITGTNFSVNGNSTFGCPGNQVMFNGTTASSTSWNSSTQISAYVPFGATTGPVSISTGLITATGPIFTVLPTPSISAASPDSGPIGTVVTVTGNFYEMDPVMYNVLVSGIPATVNSVTANSLTFTIPNGVNSLSSYSIEYFGNIYWNGSFTVTPKLTVAISGSGSGSVNSAPSGTACSGAWCRTYDFNTPILLTASPSPGSDAGVWGGNCAGAASTPCNLTMNANKSVTATFTVQDNARIAVSGVTGTTPYGTVLDAYNAATTSGSVVKLRDKAFAETLVADNGTTVTLSGGYGADFITRSGTSSISGLTISLGSLTIDNLSIK